MTTTYQNHIFNCDECNYTKKFTHFKVAQVKTIRRIHKKICKKTGRTEMPQISDELMDNSIKQCPNAKLVSEQRHTSDASTEFIEP